MNYALNQERIYHRKMFQKQASSYNLCVQLKVQ